MSGERGVRPNEGAGPTLGTWAWPVADDPPFVRFSELMGGSIGGFAIRKVREWWPEDLEGRT